MEIKTFKNKNEFCVSPSSPFHFNGTFHKPSHYPDKLDDWEAGKYWQAIRIGKRLFGLKIENKGETQKPSALSRKNYWIMIEKTLGNKKYYELSKDECWKLIKLADEAMKNTYPESCKGAEAVK